MIDVAKRIVARDTVDRLVADDVDQQRRRPALAVPPFLQLTGREPGRGRFLGDLEFSDQAGEYDLRQRNPADCGCHRRRIMALVANLQGGKPPMDVLERFPRHHVFDRLIGKFQSLHPSPGILPSARTLARPWCPALARQAASKSISSRAALRPALYAAPITPDLDADREPDDAPGIHRRKTPAEPAGRSIRPRHAAPAAPATRPHVAEFVARRLPCNRKKWQGNRGICPVIREFVPAEHAPLGSATP